jgi:SulP family sulfate permease
VLVHRVSLGSAAALWITFVSAFFIPLQFTIFLGAGLSLLLYIGASSKQLRLSRLIRNDTERYEDREVPETYPSSEATIITIAGPDFFAEVPLLDDYLPERRGVTNAVVILDVRGRQTAHSTGLRWLERYTSDLQADGNLLMLTSVTDGFMESLEASKVIDTIGADNVFPARAVLGGSIDDALDSAAIWLASGHDPAPGSSEADRGG